MAKLYLFYPRTFKFLRKYSNPIKWYNIRIFQSLYSNIPIFPVFTYHTIVQKGIVGFVLPLSY